jgi:DNA-directed RNA polymerase specialized sigma24 family protein
MVGLDTDTLFTQHRGLIYHLAGRAHDRLPIGSALDVDDLAQVAFTEVVRVAHKYDAQRSVASTWITLVVRSHFRKLIQRSYPKWSASIATEAEQLDRLRCAAVTPEQEIPLLLAEYLVAGRVRVKDRYRRLKLSDLTR